MTDFSLVLPNDTLLFMGYRNPQKAGVRDIYYSIAHWYFSEMFRGSDEVLREAILQSPTPLEAKKTADRHKERRRPDWDYLRSRVLRTGVIFAAEKNPDVVSTLRQLAAFTPLELGCAVDPKELTFGMSTSWYAGVLWEAADAYINNPHNLCIVARKNVAFAEKKTQIDRTVTSSYISQVVQPVSKEVAPIGEEYAMLNLLPIQYVQAERNKLNRDFVESLVERVHQMIIYEKKGAKLFDPLLSAAKKRSCPVKLHLC